MCSLMFNAYHRPHSSVNIGCKNSDVSQRDSNPRPDLVSDALQLRYQSSTLDTRVPMVRMKQSAQNKKKIAHLLISYFIVWKVCSLKFNLLTFKLKNCNRECEMMKTSYACHLTWSALLPWWTFVSYRYWKLFGAPWMLMLGNMGTWFH